MEVEKKLLLPAYTQGVVNVTVEILKFLLHLIPACRHIPDKKHALSTSYL